MSIIPYEKSGKSTKPMIIWVTKDFACLGFCAMTIQAGYPCLLVCAMPEDEEKLEEYEAVGNGIVDKITLEEFMKSRAKYKDAYLFWDMNFAFKENEQLRKEGFKVFGGSEFQYKCEKDRKFGTDLVKSAGLSVPDTYEFSDKEKGLAFLDEHEEEAFVFKPDDGEAGAFTTYVPDAVKDDKANRELYDYLSSMNGDTGQFILQKRIKAVEVNVELWLYKGQPYFAHANFECKRKHNKDEGEMCGCAQDIEFKVPINCKLVKNTVGRLIRLPEFKNYTGFVDMNILKAKDDYYFLEFCQRFGFNSHPNLFMNLPINKTLPELLIMMVDGDVAGFEQYFDDGFGASVTLRIDHPSKGYPIYIPEDMYERKFFLFDQYALDDKIYMAGYGEEVGIVMAHDYTIQQAAEQVLREVDKINYPCHDCRTDLDKKDYESSPILRYEALDAMKQFDP
jgi:phosphoribosylamine--glycine ligase